MTGPPPSIDNTLGFLYITVIITAALWGTGSLQGWMYFRKYNSRDPLRTRLLVMIILVLDTVQESLMCEAVYKYAVAIHDTSNALVWKVETLLVDLFIAGALGLIVQQFYCYRIYMLSKSIYLAGGVCLCSLASLAMIYTYTGEVLQYSTLSDLMHKQRLSTAANAVTAVADASITLAMIWCLGRGRSQSSRKTTRMLNHLIILTFSTGLLTTVCALLVVIILNTMPNTFIFMGIFVIRDRLYTNSVLVSLNSRDYIRGNDSSVFSAQTTLAFTRGGAASRTAPEPVTTYEPPSASPSYFQVQENRPSSPRDVEIIIEMSTLQPK